MKLAVYSIDDHRAAQLGAVIDENRIVPVRLGRGAAMIADVEELLRLDSASFQEVEQFVSNPDHEWGPSECVRVSDVRLLPPVMRPGKIMAVGQNYRSHISEVRAFHGLKSETSDLPTKPKIFLKTSSGLVGACQDVVYPIGATQFDYEGELVAVVGRDCYDVTTEDALDYISGYTIMNDLSIRNIQFNGDGDSSVFGKNFPGSAPCGPYFVSSSEFGDPSGKNIETWVNGEIRQSSNTDEMVFSVAEIVSYCSRLGLKAGDLISTGTPSGVAIYQDPPDSKLLKRGDHVRIRVEGIGDLVTAIV